MNRKLAPTILTILLFALSQTATPAHGNTPPPWTVSLDANSASTTDATIETSYNPTGSVSIGAIVNASNIHPINNVYAWQFGIVYDNTTDQPTGGTAQASVHLGAQTGPGNPNWAGQVSLGNGFMVAGISDVDATHRRILVAFTLVGTSPGANIGPALSPTVQGNLLANVNFTITQTTTSTFSITDTVFLDGTSSHNQIPGINPGPSISEAQQATPYFTITPNPPLLTITQGSSKTSTITVASLYNFAGTISLTSNSSSLIATTLTPASLSPPQNGAATSILNITASATATPGTYTISITATNGTTTQSSQVALTVTPKLIPPASSSPVTLLVIVGIVAAVALSAIIILLRRRKPAPGAKLSPRAQAFSDYLREASLEGHCGDDNLNYLNIEV